MIKKKKINRKRKKTRKKNQEHRIKFILSIVMVVLINALLLSVFFFKKDIDQLREEYILKVDRNIELKNKISKMTQGYPIEKMSTVIARKNDKVAAFLISIAKKESNWGKRSPKLNGKDCYNYWGYREKRERMGSGGHTCFDNPRDAVNTVANRIQELIDAGMDSPEKIVVWKCGYSCDAHSNYSVNKWIDDVSYYYEEF